MAFQQILEKTAETLYNEGIQYKYNQDYTNYHIYMVMSANKDYELAVKELFNDYHNTLFHFKQDYTVSKEFYELTKQYSYSLNYLGFMEDQAGRDSTMLFEKSANMGNPVALFNLGLAHYKGKFIEKNVDLAKELFTKSMEKGFGNGAFMLGELEYLSEDYDKAEHYFNKASDLGCYTGLVTLGTMYMDGKHFTKDEIKGADLYETAATLGCISGTTNLALCYYRGIGRKQDYNEARKLLEISFDKQPNDRVAIEMLGLMYWEGNGYSPDIDKAKEFFELGAKQGLVGPMMKLASILQEPAGEYKVDFVRARQLYESVIRQTEDTDYKIGAYTHLALMYGNGTYNYSNFEEKKPGSNLEKMVECYEAAIELGSTDAMRTLAELYMKGTDNRFTYVEPLLEQNYVKARELFELYLEKEEKAGIYSNVLTSLGDIYYKGLGTSIDLVKAQSFYEQAIIKKGYSYGEKVNLADIYKQLRNELDKDYVISFAITYDFADRLRTVYDYDYKQLELVKECHQLKNDNLELITVLLATLDNPDLSPKSKKYSFSNPENEDLQLFLQNLQQYKEELSVMVESSPEATQKLEDVRKIKEEEMKNKANDKCVIF